MRATTMGVWVGVCASVGCGGSPAEPGRSGPEAGVLHFDAAMLADRDGGTWDAGLPDDRPPAVVDDDGVLTPYPHIRYVVTPFELEIVSANFTVVDDGDSRGPLLSMYLEIRNRGGQIECDFTPTVTLDFQEIITTADATPHYDIYSSGTVSTVTNDCIAPGEVGVFYGVQRGIDEADLANATGLRVDGEPLRVGYTHIRASEPRIDGAVTMTAEGYAYSGTTTPSRRIRNYGIRVYPRDDRGVLVDRLLAFPGELESLAPFVAHPFETEATPRTFVEALRFQSWIDD